MQLSPQVPPQASEKEVAAAVFSDLDLENFVLPMYRGRGTAFKVYHIRQNWPFEPWEP